MDVIITGCFVISFIWLLVATVKGDMKQMKKDDSETRP